MRMFSIILVFIGFLLKSNAYPSVPAQSFFGDLYPAYTLFYDPSKAIEWSNSTALAYITTARLFDYDHHLFQYRPYPCQYFYTDEIQLHSSNESISECLYNLTTSEYQYTFQLHLDSRHIEPYILRNVALQCNYTNCSLSLLKIKHLLIDWNAVSRNNNLGCLFDTTEYYDILDTPYTITEPITIHCKTLQACNRSEHNLEQTLFSHIQLIYGSSYELATPYCSLEPGLNHLIQTNFAQTNHLIQQLVELIQRGFGQPNVREQMHMKEFIEQKLNGTDPAIISTINHV